MLRYKTDVLCIILLITGIIFPGIAVSDETGGLIPITIASEGTAATNAYTTVLEEGGYYEKYGIKVEKKYFPTNREVAYSVITGESDFAIVNTYAVADMVFEGTKPVILTSVVRFDDVYYIVVDQKAGIKSASDLKGKRIGLVTGDYWEYYLDNFLLFNGMDTSSVELIPLSSEQIMPKIVSGEIDAGLTIYQTASAICREDPERYQMWSINNNENLYLVLISSPDLVSRDPVTVEILIRAIAEGGKKYSENRDASEQILSDKFGIPLDQAHGLMAGLTTEISMTQGLLTTLESQIRYIMEKKGEKSQAEPDYLQIMNFSFINKIHPEGDTIIHE